MSSLEAASFIHRMKEKRPRANEWADRREKKEKERKESEMTL